ncbi:MAG: PHP domain-containing protein [Anaerolineales bacterium]|nr:PHP domain-containing protein [Anaerolineales bacterium]
MSKMNVYEYKGHIHIHTRYSDGDKLHAEIAQDASAAGLDYIIITDHNLWVDGVEGYYGHDLNKRTLLLVGEEVHDVRRQPQSNHCLVFGAEREMSPFASEPNVLFKAVEDAGGFCYLAHPFEIGSPLYKSAELDALGWSSWEVQGYTGLEIWNYLSEFKSHLVNKLAAVHAAYRPERFIKGPFSEALEKWDALLASGQQVACLGGGDVHGRVHRLGPFSRRIFPYPFHFKTLNTHILTHKPLNGEFIHDKQLVLNALHRGSAWVGYDAAGDTEGFRFSGQAHKQQAAMGETVKLKQGTVTFQISIPSSGHIRLLYNGQVVEETAERPHLMVQCKLPGAYRVEVFKHYAGQKRGWIYSNPIYVTDHI